MLLQLGLGAGGGERVSGRQTHRLGAARALDARGAEQGAGRGGVGEAAGLTSRLMASLVFWKQSTNSASDGGRARSVRTPSAVRERRP